MFDFAREMYFDERAPRKKNMRERSRMRLLKSPAIVISGILTILLPENPIEICDGVKILLHEKEAGNNSDKKLMKKSRL